MLELATTILLAAAAMVIVWASIKWVILLRQIRRLDWRGPSISVGSVCDTDKKGRQTNIRLNSAAIVEGYDKRFSKDMPWLTDPTPEPPDEAT